MGVKEHSIFDGKTPIWSVGLASIEILMPKKRGIGYLKVPCGHHYDKKIDDIIDSIKWKDNRGRNYLGFSEYCGLDGTISLVFGFNGTTSVSKEEAENIVRQLTDALTLPNAKYCDWNKLFDYNINRFNK